MFFAACFIFASKHIFANLLNSGVVIKLMVSGILFSISEAFLFKVAFVPRSKMSGVSLSTSAVFVFRAAYVLLVISNNLSRNNLSDVVPLSRSLKSPQAISCQKQALPSSFL